MLHRATWWPHVALPVAGPGSRHKGWPHIRLRRSAGGPREVLTFPARRATLSTALAKQDELADGADFVLAHNLIGFDLRHLEAASPQLRLLVLPAVDTLRLNPLAFPENPYHYQEGQLKRGRINDPELDDRLALADHGGRQLML